MRLRTIAGAISIREALSLALCVFVALAVMGQFLDSREPSVAESVADMKAADASARRATRASLVAAGITTCSEWLKLSAADQNDAVVALADGHNAQSYRVKQGCLGEAYTKNPYEVCPASRQRNLADQVQCAVALDALDPHEIGRQRDEELRQQKIDERIKEGG